MKCPHCYCNYDDTERECPMCGTRSSLAACKNAKHKAISYQGTRVSNGRTVPTMLNNSRTAKNTRTKTAASAKKQTKPVYNQSSRETADAMQRRRRKLITIVVVLILLLNFLPALISGILHLADDLLYSAPFMEEDSWDSSYEESVLPPADAVEADSYYYCEDLDLYLDIYSDDTYAIVTPDYSETGALWCLYNDPEEEDGASYYTAEFPSSQYESYIYYFERDEEYVDEEGTYYTLAVAYHPLDDDEVFYLDNVFADALWLPLDRAVEMRAY